VTEPVTDERAPPRPERPSAHARDHYGAATDEPRRAITSACPRRPLHARLRRPKRRARNARLRPRLWTLNGSVPYQVSVTLARPELRARKIRPSKGAITDQWSRSPLSESGRHRCPRFKRITDQQLVGQFDCKPTSPADVERRGHPAATPQRPY
jgi:hypothetical protein